MQARCAASLQLLAQVGDHIQAKSLDGRGVVTKALQPQTNPARDLGAAGIAEAHELGNW